jgi:cytochrome c oxidase subunit 3
MSATPNTEPYYYVPQPSHWPITGSCALLLMAVGAATWFNAYAVGPWLVLAGFTVLVTMMFGWFGRVIDDSGHHLYNKKVDLSFRWGMSWFIFSEVMFLRGVFRRRCSTYATLSVPGLGDMESKPLWPNYTAMWLDQRPVPTEAFSPMGAIGIPLLLNTILLVSSGGI